MAQSLGLELLVIVPRQSSLQKDVSAGHSQPFSITIILPDYRCIDVMRTLLDKYPDGYEGWAKARGEDFIVR